MKKAGDLCPYCGQTFTEEMVEDRKRRRLENAEKSRIKALANGKRFCGKPKRDNKKIWDLHDMGCSQYQIARMLKCSRTTVIRSLKERKIRAE